MSLTVEQMKPFCSTELSRPYLHTPFSLGEFTVATNGHILVRVPRMANVAEISQILSVDALFHDPVKGYRELGRLDIPVVAETIEKCGDCNGRGTYGHAHDCPDCTCDETCEECNGTGKVTRIPKISVEIGGLIFDAKYVRMLLALPNLQIEGRLKKAERMRFTFDGGDGALMPMRAEHETHVKEAA